MDFDLEFELKISRRDLRVLLLHEFRLGHKATETNSSICSTAGKDLLSFVQRNIGSIGSRTVF